MFQVKLKRILVYKGLTGVGFIAFSLLLMLGFIFIHNYQSEGMLLITSLLGMEIENNLDRINILTMYYVISFVSMSFILMSCVYCFDKFLNFLCKPRNEL